MASTVEQSDRVHTFLLDPSSYPERPKNVELKETHISWVYLTDRYVYKRKKPIAFEFLDFSTLKKRQHYCEQEVELNRRFSPEVYLGVVPVSVSNGEYHLKSGNTVVEWLVKMTRLDDSQTLENLICNEQLSKPQLRGLSQKVTGFYSAQAPAMVRSNDFLNRLSHHVRANRNDLLIAMPNAELAIQFASNAQLRCLALESEYFVQRVADGRVVDGHGDLRPEHVYFQRSKPVIIDCIEFNAEYRTNDVVDELAFLSMECDRLGNHDVGESIMAAYHRASSDAPKPFLSAFYRCYRACVRAKVAALRSTQTHGNEKLKSNELARNYLDLAQGYTKSMGAKLLVMVGGLSGTGKSTLATALRDSLFAELLQTDVIRKDVFQPDLPNGKYTNEGRHRVYQEMSDRVADSFARSPTVIVDGTFSTQAARQLVYAKAVSAGAKVLQVQCECPTDVARSRISARLEVGGDPSEATADVHATQSFSYEAPLADPPAFRVKTTTTVDTQTSDVMSRVRDFYCHD